MLIAIPINIYMQTKLFGFTSTFGLLGWFIIILSGSIAVGLPLFGITIPGFDASSPIFYACMGVGAVLMLLLNNVKRNPLINFGAGLWDAYNNITGLLSDVLSYIRLYALGLAGGMLGNAFNIMGTMILDIPIPALNWVFCIVILIFGHVLNLAMSCLGAFVHPLRLTFVEYFKNSGYEGTGKFYSPLTTDKEE